MATLNEVLEMFTAFGLDLKAVLNACLPSDVGNKFEGQKILAEIAWDDMDDEKREELRPTIERIRELKLTKWKRQLSKMASMLEEVAGERVREFGDAGSLRRFEMLVDAIHSKENEVEFQDREPCQRKCRCGAQFVTRDPGKDICTDCATVRIARDIKTLLAKFAIRTE